MFAATECIEINSLDADDELVLAGSLRGISQWDSFNAVSSSDTDVLLGGLDFESGKTKWIHVIPGSGRETARTIGFGPDGSVILQVQQTGHNTVHNFIQWFSRKRRAVGAALVLPDKVGAARLFADDDILTVAAPVWRGPSTISRTESSGRVLWSTTLAASRGIAIRSFLIDGSEIVVIGSLRGNPRFGNGLWEGTRGSPTYNAFFAARLHADNGKILRVRWLFSERSQDYVDDATLDGSDVVLAVNSGPLTIVDRDIISDGSRYVSIVSLEDDFEHVKWLQQFRVASRAWTSRLIASNGNVLLVGSGDSKISVATHAFGGRGAGHLVLAELVGSGRVSWATEWQTGSERPPSIVRDRNGNIYVAGLLMRSIDMQSNVLVPQGKGSCDSIFVAKLSLR